MEEEAASIFRRRRLLQRMFVERRKFVLCHLRTLRVPEGELEDATQEVFLVVCQRVQGYQERGQLSAWLRAICARVAWNRRRGRKRRREDLVESLEIEVDATQHTKLIDHAALVLGCHLLQSLPTQQRDVFLSYLVDGERMTDIARAAKCPLQTAYSRLNSARSRISAAVKARERAVAIRALGLPYPADPAYPYK